MNSLYYLRNRCEYILTTVTQELQQVHKRNNRCTRRTTQTSSAPLDRFGFFLILNCSNSLIMKPKTHDFENEIIKKQNDARQQGLSTIQINALELHKDVGGYESHNHRMAAVCSAMHNLMTKRDEIIYSPLKGKGSRLTIQYRL